ncbi:MAG TPA: DUF1698 domain-containing protein [Vineibacter sp.]|nr:DUF1698 domain-containing protein [Vineibacter sp.]
MLSDLARKASDWLANRVAPAKWRRAAPERVLDRYVQTTPSAQNAIDAVPGWTVAMPPHVGAVAGTMPLYPDFRIVWCLEQFGSIAGRKILELGPLEGVHTYQLEQQEPELIHSIEANRLSFLRCLVSKELLDLKRTKFLHGNFVPYLEQTELRYDLVVASGVLYHMRDPVGLLQLIARRTNTVYLWTHYFSDAEMPPGDQRRASFSGEVDWAEYGGARIALHRRGYRRSSKSLDFCGGMYDRHYWMEREGILEVLTKLGFDDIRVTHVQPDHPRGPAFSVFARRSGV